MTNAHVSGQEAIYQGRVISVELQTLQLADGRVATNEVVLHRPCVAMVAVDESGKLVLVRQFRAPAAADLLEIPAGSIDEGESVEAAAQRELQEETGYRAATIRRIGGFYSAPGYCTEFLHILLCEGLSESRLPGDEDELIEVERLSLDAALSAIESGAICDAKSVAGLLLYARSARASQ